MWLDKLNIFGSFTILEYLWINFLLILNSTIIIMGVSKGVLITAKNVYNLESTKQGELACLLVFNDFFAY
jgi:hypothetical protein